MSSSTVKFIDKLPYKARLELCQILDFNNDWKVLGGILDFKLYELFQMENAILRRDSPTNELLSKMVSKNHTVSELFKHLYEMKHFQAMLVLKPFVDPSYHKLIPGGSRSIHTITGDCSLSSVEILETKKPPRTNSKVNVKNEPLVKQVNNPCNQPTRKVSDPLTPMNVLGGTPHIPYDELTVATNNWNPNNILGRGGFGTVYRGLWKNTPIAIKKLEVQKSNKSEETLNQCQREQSLRELKYLNSCRHKNILPLDGISFESGKYCLVYRYMENGSLEDRLLMRRNKPPLSWDDRLNIAKGAASGIQFLHAQEPPLIHGDIKSANILLNDHMEPVIGDFGLTQEGPIEKATHVTLKRVNGTRPYLPVDFLMDRKLSTKVDVYAFGIVLFELATGMRAYDENRTSERLLKDLVEKHYKEKNNLIHLADKSVQPLQYYDKFIDIGILCINKLSKERPEMIQVHSRLCGGSGGESPSPSTIPTPCSPTVGVADTSTPRYDPIGRHKFNNRLPLLQQTNPHVNQIVRTPLQQPSNNVRPQQMGTQRLGQDNVLSHQPKVLDHQHEPIHPIPHVLAYEMQRIHLDNDIVKSTSKSLDESEESCCGTTSSSDQSESIQSSKSASNIQENDILLVTELQSVVEKNRVGEQENVDVQNACGYQIVKEECTPLFLLHRN
uniref:non-specific serine/threonine protein kinase n=1 Tax=Cacopsylla melanoneura TaxID=428564 RepID=A0A8D9BQK7_9HEMI